MFSQNVTGQVGRNSHRLFIPRMQTTYGQKSLFYRGTVAWNIEQTLYLATSLKTFKLVVVQLIRYNVVVIALYMQGTAEEQLLLTDAVYPSKNKAV